MNRPFINRAVLNRMIERHERHERLTITLGPKDYHELPAGWQRDVPKDMPPSVPAVPAPWGMGQ